MPPDASAQVLFRPRRTPWSNWLGRNIGLLLAIAMLAGSIGIYCVIFYARQGIFPGGFELTSTVNNTMPLVLAALAQAMVVLTRGIDLSVGGMIDLTNAVAAIRLGTTAGSMILWSVVILLIGAALGLLNGLLVAIGRLQPILVTLATLAIFQGLAIRVLPQPGGAVPDVYTRVLANTSYPLSLVYLVAFGLLWIAFRRTSLGRGDPRHRQRRGGIEGERHRPGAHEDPRPIR